jgi:hypothetical protein
MRRLAVLLVLAAGAWILLSRRRAPGPVATIGYDDGSTLVLEPGSPELERLVRAADWVLQP